MSKFNEQVLQMIKEGRISVEDAQKLIEAQGGKGAKKGKDEGLLDIGLRSVKEIVNYMITLELPEDMRAKKIDIDLAGLKKVKVETHKTKLRIKHIHTKRQAKYDVVEVYIPKEHVEGFGECEDGSGYVLRYRP